VHLLKGLKLCAPICSFVCFSWVRGSAGCDHQLAYAAQTLRSQGATTNRG
jgi:hypothetical protein